MSFSQTGLAWLLFLMLAVCSVYCFIKPLILSIDSAYGFLAYKGTLFFHSFNVLQDIPTRDIGQMNHIFMSWWSPGQWIFPGLLNYFFGIRLGIGAILITLASLISGFFGYYRVFRFFKFPSFISGMSLLAIFSSATLYYCFIIYQGGEILEFAFFPWFLLYVFRIREISTWNLFGIGILFFLCFIAKTTLIVYCALVIIAKLFLLIKSSTGKGTGFQFSFTKWALLLPAVFMMGLIYLFYLSRGPHPTLMNHFQISPEGFLIPLSSPLTSILSVQQWIERITKAMGGSLTGNTKSIFIYFGLYLIVTSVLYRIIRKIIRSSSVDFSYKALFLILYTGLVAFFVFAYSFNTNIDYSSRHFKLMGYMLIPGILTLLNEKISSSIMQVLVIVLSAMSMIDIFYLKEKWIKDRYISINYFYRNCEPLPNQDKLDYRSYQKLIEIDRRLFGKSDKVIFFVESSAVTVSRQNMGDAARSACRPDRQRVADTAFH